MLAVTAAIEVAPPSEIFEAVISASSSSCSKNAAATPRATFGNGGRLASGIGWVSFGSDAEVATGLTAGGGTGAGIGAGATTGFGAAATTTGADDAGGGWNTFGTTSCAAVVTVVAGFFSGGARAGSGPEPITSDSVFATVFVVSPDAFPTLLAKINQRKT